MQEKYTIMLTIIYCPWENCVCDETSNKKWLKYLSNYVNATTTLQNLVCKLFFSRLPQSKYKLFCCRILCTAEYDDRMVPMAGYTLHRNDYKVRLLAKRQSEKRWFYCRLCFQHRCQKGVPGPDGPHHPHSVCVLYHDELPWGKRRHHSWLPGEVPGDLCGGYIHLPND